MEQWNDGRAGNAIGFSIFQYSIIPIFQSFFSAFSVAEFFPFVSFIGIASSAAIYQKEPEPESAQRED